MTATPEGVGRTFARRLESSLWMAGLGLLAVCIAVGVRVASARQAAAEFTPGVQQSSPSQTNVAETSNAWAATGVNGTQVVGRVEIPAIGLMTPLLAGDDSMSLSEGAGHIPGTAYPGGLGTVGIAGHRDTHFRQLRKAAKGMDVRLVDRTGTYHYRITSSEIVTPDKVSVLDIQSTPGLVLITCYPFSYIGKAPRRFVVHAELVSVAPDEPRS
jgi:sortase A